MSYLDEKQRNPWLSMWSHPRETVRQYIQEDLSKWIWFLVIVSGMKFVLDNANIQNFGDQVPVGAILFWALFIGSFIGILQWWMLSGSLLLVGRVLGLEAEWKDLKKAVSLSNVPYVWGFVLWIVKIFAFGQENFTPETPMIDQSLTLVALIVLCYLIDFILVAWSVAVLSKGIGEVYGLSSWAGFGLVLLTGVVLTLVFLLIGGPIVLLLL
ncbi:Yip1 domain-containing protein [Marininema mesophilum]|uniref:Yip1 domain-containing protein n=1 Tax=Marininema mesophilum TaxID=1048340 RepID=A0A1H2WBP3_9BACL|nr:YIP1 family protein [Marininema mesophilum]SDW77957.1 Yip1 domain-containing protein [Marininema mesophilum]